MMACDLIDDPADALGHEEERCNEDLDWVGVVVPLGDN